MIENILSPTHLLLILVAPLTAVTDPTMGPAPGRDNSAMPPPDRTGRSDGEAARRRRSPWCRSG
jgi:hypothetical protein